MTPSADKAVLEQNLKPEPRSKGRKHQPLWNATFNEIAAFKRVVPSDLGLQRAATRERVKFSVNEYVVRKDGIDQPGAFRGFVLSDLAATAREKTKQCIYGESTDSFLAAQNSINQPAETNKRLREGEHHGPKYSESWQEAARKRAKHSKILEYFCPKDGIDREVITEDICRYLRDDALVRPGDFKVYPLI